MTEYKILNKINSPADVKALDKKEIPELCEEIRKFLIENVEKQGGHLASNLGITELTLALHRVFNSPDDHIVFDVGHQSYVHKMLTGRKEAFGTLRRTGGISGFTNMSESVHDAFGAGHSSTSVSAALGYAEADRLKGSDAYSIAVIGDGAYTGGMVHEALNNCESDLKLIIILNENGMSISLNKGTFASYLTRVRVSKGYRHLKSGTKNIIQKLPLLGKPIQAALTFIKTKIKNLLFASNYFEDLGLYYIGPVDGNNFKKVEGALQEAKSLGKCVVVHVKTQKGKGYEPAEKSPDDFHSVYSQAENKQTFHSVFADKLVSDAEKDDRIVTVTAAMGIGTGLTAFGEKYPDRYFDVGIAEPHALTFSAGLAAAGYKPFAAIYSTFLQRGYDSIVHDICLQRLPVRMIIDRAGISVSDGATHHGIFDVAFLSHIPNIKILCPITYASLREAIEEAENSSLPIAIRYSNKSENTRVIGMLKRMDDKFGVLLNFELTEIPEYVFITYGTIVDKVIEARDILIEKDIKAGILVLERLKPYDEYIEFIKTVVLSAKKTVFVEEGIKCGGAGMIIGSMLAEAGIGGLNKYEICAVDDNFANPREKSDIFKYLKLDGESLAEKII